MDIWTEEERLTRTLAGIAAVNVGAGALAWATLGRRSPLVRGVARQAVAWGLVDGVIAARGEIKRRKDFEASSAPAAYYEVNDRTRKLRRALRLNAWLDIGYIAAGAGLALAAPRLSRGDAEREALLRGDGLGIVKQGALLHGLDVMTVRRIDALT